MVELKRVPRTAWVCAIVACLNAACWSVISAPFQVVDEPSHFAYVQLLAEQARLPSDVPPGSPSGFSEEESIAQRDLHQQEVQFNTAGRTISTEAQREQLDRNLAAKPNRQGSGYAGVATPEPPLYYALQTIPYGLIAGSSILNKLELMRLVSALMGGLTALLIFMFIREALPGAPWAWTVGGLATALTPLLAYISGAVNPDALLFTVSATVLYLLARGFRRGLTPRLAAMIGAATAAGFLTKVNFIGIAPGIFLGLLLLSLRAAAASKRTAILCFASGAAVAVSPIVLYLIANLLAGHPGLGIVSTAITHQRGHGSLPAELSYIWQLFLPHLPGMTNDFPGVFTTRQYWFNGLIGLYGWLDTQFPGWAYDVALIPAGLIAALGIRAFLANRASVRLRIAELVTYVAMYLGMLAVIGADGYFKFPGETATYSETRYMFPLLALYGAVLALAARGAGRRWGPLAGALIVLTLLAHDIFSQLLVISRYYS